MQENNYLSYLKKIKMHEDTRWFVKRGRNGYEARKVCDNFDLTYHLATATTYILRAYHKHDTPVDCLKKAIAHLEFELEKILSLLDDFMIIKIKNLTLFIFIIFFNL